MRVAASAIPGVAVTAATGREHDSDVLVELSIHVDPHMTVELASQLAEQVRESVCARLPNVGDVMVEMNTDHFARLRKKLR